MNKISTRLSQSLDPSRRDAIISQIVDTIWQDVIDGTLGTGELLPTVRELSVELGMSPRTISRSYERLEQLGVLTSQHGGGTVVSLHAADPAQRQRWRELETICKSVADQAQSLGFTLDEIIDALTDLRSHHT
jgi:DNA-binding transcriptional regulator YhcF (GntR family)